MASTTPARLGFLLALVILLQLCGVEGQVFKRAQQRMQQRRNSTTSNVQLKEGHPIRLLSAPTRGGDERFITVAAGDSTTPHLVPAEWSELETQIWVPSQAYPGRYLFIQKRSGVNYTTFKDVEAKDRVLSLDSLTGNVTVEAYSPGSTSQQWTVQGVQQQQQLKAEVGGEAVLLRNYGNEQCLKNYDHKGQNILKRIASFIQRLREPYRPKPPPHPLSTLDCSGLDQSQRWIAVEV